jgi:hypothetical protein
MKTKTSKSQLQIWAAKERLSIELLELPENQRIAHIIKKTKSTVDALKKRQNHSKAI